MNNKIKFYIFAFIFGFFMGALTAFLSSNLFWLVFQTINLLFWIFLIKKIKGF